MALLALVLLGVQVELARLVDDRALDGLAGRAVDAADHDIDVGVDEPLGSDARDVVVGGAVLDEQLHGASEDAAACVDVVDDHSCDVDVGEAHERQGAGLIGDDADPSRAIEDRAHRIPLTRRTSRGTTPTAACRGGRRP